ncbi:hypothetical protein NQ015_01805 [Corynebacterium sp. 153RC1]|uniref:hypothetical protein n=1 Tax=Corynebacterium TaxID=1716 RepID=UPI00211CE3A2|nr:hypothetical protein [Corynebacterium sp. 76QC2CO]MCQ9352338.1 hypothetical protein [Corynebacterium sp. 209RC1]MCQ9354272.1 hypothetical protein [Corynebacterium sp. 1222RC1]MCQ9356554.1 hypothetical protein [Corynebacterium sp. 122RC1]MCQ9358862.1 hypothetical protein [Corynebacterium sp. 142RC1]MCQ9360506.1 hypothetical protein [Corynebacterium sp. 153RC1]MCQ9362632.1 hypothetical protein [Corynebacterium sp. 732RC1]MCQ9365658.1 hypothetical protein [Corynebacterium sp. 70RC1]MCQ93706
MIQFVVGAAAGYVFGTKAGRKRYEQIKKGYKLAVESPVTKQAVKFTRQTLANKLDPQPRMKEVRNLKQDDGSTVLEPDQD